MNRRHATIILAVSLSCLITSSVVRAADEDGGARSVFARGAGERALALGGAYGAVADGPSALFWNPAGLGRLERTGLQAAHTDLIGLGFYEQFGALAVPNWRLGTFALTYRRFGVDGIEGRDDRGSLLDENLENAETEMMLGYGRALGTAWSFGLALKVQNQKLAGHSGSGTGLDLGLLVKPLEAAGHHSPLAQALSLGVTFRNVIEPTIVLIDDEVRDPGALRLGAALDLSLGRHLDAMLTADVDKTKSMDTRLHAGCELRIMELLALRGGTNAGTLSAGAGVRWKSVAVDYALEDNTLETVHRFGLGMSFGATVSERRQASLDRQEEELNARLGQAFAQDRQRRIDDLSARAQAALDQGNYALARTLTNTLRVIDPDDPTVDAIDAAAYLGQARAEEDAHDLIAAGISYRRCLGLDPGNAEADTGLRRVTAESAQLAQRSQEIESLFAAGLEHYAAGDLQAAQQAFMRVLDLNPGDTEAQQLLESTQQTLALRAEAQAEQERALAAARSRETTPPVMVAATPEPESEPESEQVEIPYEAPARPTFAQLPASRRAEIEDLYQRGATAAAAGRRDEAIRYWELVYDVAPDYQKVSDHLKQEYLARGMEAFAAGRLDRAIEIWEQAQVIDPDDPRTQGYLARAYEHRTKIQQIRGSS